MVVGVDQNGNKVNQNVVIEKAVNIFLNSQEVITAMTVGDHLDYLAVGFLVNQNMISKDDDITGIDFDEDIQTVVVRTKNETVFEQKSKKKIKTSGCANGTIFGDVLDKFEEKKISSKLTINSNYFHKISKIVTSLPSLYLKAGAIHGCVLCNSVEPLVYFEDVGRHNAVDKVAGYLALEKIDTNDKILYTTGRLTSEMVIKTVIMGVPILMSRSGFTAWGVELAKKANLTLIGRLRGARFIILSGKERIIIEE